MTKQYFHFLSLGSKTFIHYEATLAEDGIAWIGPESDLVKLPDLKLVRFRFKMIYFT